MPTRCDPEVLATVSLFRGLTPKQLAWLADHLHRVAFPAGSSIMTAEQPGEAIYIVFSGTVKVHVDQADGSSVILDILGPGEIVGEMSLLDSGGRSASVVTLEQSVLLWMDRGSYQECLGKMPVLACNTMAILCDRLRRANEQIQALATLNVHGRVARQILALAQRYGRVTPGGDVQIPIRLTQGDMGCLVGASRERVNGAIGAYRRHRQISVDPEYRIIVHDPDALARSCQWFTLQADWTLAGASPVTDSTHRQ